MEIVMIKEWAAAAAGLGSRILVSLLLRSAIKHLLAIDEKSLLEVGLSRSDVVECLATPITTDPAKFLASRGRRCDRKSHAAQPSGWP
jgi:hypothetical protein